MMAMRSNPGKAMVYFLSHKSTWEVEFDVWYFQWYVSQTNKLSLRWNESSDDTLRPFTLVHDLLYIA